MFSNNSGAIPKDLHDAFQDDQDWRDSGKPPRGNIWTIYKVVRDPSSYRRLVRSSMIELLEREGISDPCPISEEEWARQNPEDARKTKKVKAHLAERQREMWELLRKQPTIYV